MNAYDIPANPPPSPELGITVSKLVPICSKVEVILACAPLPIDISEITAPTPIMMPSMVSEERSLLADSDLRAMIKDSMSFTDVKLQPFIADNPPIHESDDTLGLSGNVHLMSNYYYGDTILVELTENRNNLSSRDTVQITGRLIS